MFNEAVHVVAADTQMVPLGEMEALPASDQYEGVVILNHTARPVDETEVELLLGAGPVPADQLGSDGLGVGLLRPANHQHSLRPRPRVVILKVKF